MEMNFTPSEQQQAVLDFGLTGKGSLVLIARAGTGKSSTLLALVKALAQRYPFVSIFVGAYNKAIGTEFSNRLTAATIGWKTCKAGTFHSAGRSALKQLFGWDEDECKRRTDENKCEKLLDAEMKTDAQKLRVEPYKAMILKAVDLAKQRAFGVLCHIDDNAKWFDIIDHFGLDEDLPEDADLDFAVKCCIWLYKRSLNTCREAIDFNDMILAPLFFKAKFWKYDWVMIDEAQDTNPARRALALAMLKPGGRLIAVGDDAQAIYGFTGADADSLELIRKAVNAQVLPLTVTRRCPKVAVRRVKHLVPDFEAHESAPEGSERVVYLATKNALGQDIPNNIFAEGSKLNKDAAVLCRNNKPLVELAYALIRRGIGCQVEGRKIGNGLIALINKWKAVNINPLVEKLVAYREKEVAKWLAKENEAKAEEVNDRVETILALAAKLQEEGKQRVSDLVDFIDSLFGDTKQDDTTAEFKPQVLTLASYHKSKGREWKRVYLLGESKYAPSKWARKEWQMKQENNLMYVAGTRVLAKADDPESGEIVDILVEAA